MKTHLVVAALSWCCIRAALAGQSSLTTTWQPLDSISSERIEIVSVTCHHWYSNSASSAVDLIQVRNVPPTDNPKEANEDLNLASVCRVKFSTSDLGLDSAPPELVMDASGFAIPERFAHHSKDAIIRACLECLRLSTPLKLAKTPVTLKCRETDKA